VQGNLLLAIMKFIFYTILTALTALVAFQVYALVTPRDRVRQKITDSPAAPEMREPNVSKRQTAKLNDAQRTITRRNLFDVEVDKHQNLQPENISQLEKTNLKITLWGTVTTAGKKNKGWAVIEEGNNKKQTLYNVGDIIQNGTIKSILRNQIILSVNGKDQILEVRQDLRPNREKRKSPPHTSPKQQDQPTASQKKQVDLDAVKELTGDIEPAPEQPLFKTRAYYGNGRESGVMIYGIRRGASAQALGLKNGDVVQAVDDIDITSPQDLESMMDRMDGDSDITVLVIRRGKTKEIVYNEQEKSFAVNDVE
jgi:general secretion pathway protein C